MGRKLIFYSFQKKKELIFTYIHIYIIKKKLKQGNGAGIAPLPCLIWRIVEFTKLRIYFEQVFGNWKKNSITIHEGLCRFAL